MKVRDPVCGKIMKPEAAIVLEHGAHRHYFCSILCRDMFVGSPQRYEDKVTPVAATSPR